MCKKTKENVVEQNEASNPTSKGQAILTWFIAWVKNPF